MVIWTLLACTGGGDKLPVGSSTVPDVIVVSIDTLRADHLSSYGYSRPTSPFIDSLAAQGVRFARARSASPWTLPAHTTLLTGQLPLTHRVVDDTLSLSDQVPYLPALFQEAGYETGGFVSTLYVSKMFGFQRGFDRFEDFGIDSEKENLHGDLKASDVIDEALEWWEDRPEGAPVFLFLHFYDAHYAYDPPEPYASMFDRAPQKGDAKYKNYFHFAKKPLGDAQMAHQIAQYDESIRYIDDQLARLQAASAAAGRSVRWVVTADHGEEFGERGSWGHAHTLYAEQLHIPLIISGPGVAAGQVVEDWVGNHDIAPTVAAWAGMAGRLSADGIDLSPAMAGAPLPARPFLAETTRFKTNRLSLLEGDLRLEWDIKADRIELFNTTADPAERTDLAAARSEDAQRMVRRAVDLLGEDWQAERAGTVKPAGAYILADGQRRSRLKVTGGERFVILPYDAEVTFNDAGQSLGPWAAVGGKAPTDGDPLRLLRAAFTANIDMDAQTRAALEALGYIQE